MSASRSSPRSAVACATSLDSSMKEETCLRSRASGASAVSESRARSARTLFCEASSARTLSTSLSAGSARRMTWLSSEPRPATPVPNSARISDSRCR